MKRTLLIIITLVTTNVLSQSSTNSKFNSNLEQFQDEKIHLHYNSDFLLSGERLYYKLYCQTVNNQFTPFSKIAYVELLDKENKSLLKQKINLTNGNGYGDIFINTQVKTGTYKLLAYTKWMQNKGNYFTKNIYVINPFADKIAIDAAEASNATTTSKPSTSTSNSLFSVNRSTFGKREQITLNINQTAFEKIDGSFSISVSQKNDLNTPQENKVLSIPNKSAQFYIPELRGSLIKGKLSSTSKKISDIKLSLSISGSNRLPLTAITNSSGEFYFNIENLNNDTVYLSILEEDPEGYALELNNDSETVTGIQNFPGITLNQRVVDAIKKRSLYSQIENAYLTVKKDSILKTATESALLNTDKIVYELDDYKRFNTIKETFIEVVEGAGFFKKGETFKLNVTDTDASETLSYLPSLLIIDGRIVNDHDTFMRYNSRKIKTISLIRDKYFYGNAMYQGIILVDSFKKDYFLESNTYQKFTVKPIQPEKIYFFQEHHENNKRIPDFRSQLYWNPEVRADQTQISFFTSDVKGTFEIVAQGFNKEGKLVTVKTDFTVE